MAGYTKDELKRQYEVAQRETMVRTGQGVMQDFTFISHQEIAELAKDNLRLAVENEPAEICYIDDKRFVRVCAINEEEPEQITAVYEDRKSGQEQNPAPSTTPQRHLVAVPRLAQA